VLYSKKIIEIHLDKMQLLRFSVIIGSICNFTFGLVQIRSPLISTILYSIWTARKDREFTGKYLPPTEMVQRTMKNLHELQSNQGARVPAAPIESEKNRHNI
jgi:hypothetical protein